MENGATPDNILKSEIAGDEAGLLKCLFIVDTRYTSCLCLQASSFEEMHRFLTHAEAVVPPLSDDVREARSWLNW